MFLIIDGSSLLQTSFYGNCPKNLMRCKTEEEREPYYKGLLHAKDGTYTNAIYGMLVTLLKILREQQPEYMAVCFDKSRESLFRKILYPEYKAQRNPSPKPLKDQMILMEQILENVGIKVFYSDGYEADDYAASLVKRYKAETDIVLLTKDHDYCQLVDTNVKLWMLCNSLEQVTDMRIMVRPKDENYPDKTCPLDIEGVRIVEGVYPIQIPDKKGIAGDASDNIPGIKGISDKTAIPLLNEYGTIEGIYNAIEFNEENFVKTAKMLGIKRSPLKPFLENKQMGLLSKELATMVSNLLDTTQLQLSDFAVSNINRTIFDEEMKKLDINLTF